MKWMKSLVIRVMSDLFYFSNDSRDRIYEKEITESNDDAANIFKKCYTPCNAPQFGH